MKPRIITIAGPTASGKTSLAIQVAQHYKTEIISIDSRQCYHEMNIGVARPEQEQLALVKHHFIADRSIHKPLTAAAFAAEARMKIDSILLQNNVVVICGGTGLYLRALLYGLHDLPTISPSIRDEVNLHYEQAGISGLVARIAELDIEAINQIETSNPARVKRALEILLSSPELPLATYFQPKKDAIKYPFINYCLNPEREALYRQIELRCEIMMERGQLEEARNLLPNADLPVLKTVGYSELFEHFRGNATLQQAIDKIKQHTRNYAKRQLTWFKHQVPCTMLNTDTALKDIISAEYFTGLNTGK
jgi:tRNA dimethylallyltransferase